MSEKKELYTVTSPIKRNGKPHAIGDKIKLTADEAEGLHVVPAGSPAGKQAEAEADAVAGDKETTYSKKDLEGENKDFTEDLCKAAGYPEDEWGDLNKGPLIDYYLEKQAAAAEEN